MVLESLKLVNFRLHKDTELKFSDNLNYIAGGNGHGKTTILEAIYYLCTSRSLNGASDSEVPAFGNDFFEINGHFNDLSVNDVRIYYNTDAGKKAMFLDEKQFYRASALIGRFPVVTLVQSDHSITMGSPGDRRRFVDSVISQASSTYLKILIDYNKTLRQRSFLLGKLKEGYSTELMRQLDAWNATLVKNGSELIKHRLKFVEVFNEYLCEAYTRVMDDREVPEIIYSFFNEKDPGKIEELFYDKIIEFRNDELRRGVNLAGPHRDEFYFLVNRKELKKFGSQGQHKTFQIALRFGEFFYLKDSLGKTPVFLLDDVFGELDAFRAEKISEYLKETGQAFITMTDFSKSELLKRSGEDMVINVKNGITTYA